MYSDRPRRGGFGGGYRRDGDNDNSNWRSRQSDQGGYGDSTEMFVAQSLVGRIIGKGGSKIRELEDSSGAGIKVNSREAQNGQVQIVLSGSDESRRAAEDLINEIVETFEGDGRGGGGGYGGSRYGGGGGGYGGGRGGRDYDGGSRGRSSTCYQCGKEGHFARDCPEQSGY